MLKKKKYTCGSTDFLLGLFCYRLSFLLKFLLITSVEVLNKTYIIIGLCKVSPSIAVSLQHNHCLEGITTYQSIFSLPPRLATILLVFHVKPGDLTPVVIPPTQLNVDVGGVTPEPLRAGW